MEVIEMNAMKNFIKCILISAIMATAHSVTTSADSCRTTAEENCAIIDENQYHEYLQSLSKEQLQNMQQKEMMINNIMNNIESQSNNSRSVTKLSIPGNFRMYQQEADTYCIPACIKSVLMYTSNTSPAQSDIDSSINMHFTLIPSYVNHRQNQCSYLFSENPSQAFLTTSIYTDITIENAPTFLRISNTSTSNWYYYTSGHCVLSNAIYSDYSQIQIADPYGDKISGCPYFYLKSASTVANYTTDIVY